MARDYILLSFIGMDILFVVAGGILIIFALMIESKSSDEMTVDTVSRNLLLLICPAKAAIGNAVLIFITFLASVPAMVIPSTRGWLKLHGYMTTICALFTMILGLSIWFQTLKTRTNLFTIWLAQTAETQSLLQQEFNCCGYMNATTPPFIVDTTCRNSLVAANLGGCVGPFSSFANNFLDMVFTGAFGIVGVDVILIIMTAILLKDRKEKERYRHIDEKNGTGAF
ncbi:hypothetical protein B0O99DRAFT_252827 [Bisporella sp. PMI_857]|nr:hypothetical protein B0O99DRAFT_252827 [Bisporella sp. PMI_857]